MKKYILTRPFAPEQIKQRQGQHERQPWLRECDHGRLVSP